MTKYLIILLSVFQVYHLKSQETFIRSALLMGCNFELTIVTENTSKSQLYLDLAINEIKRIEGIISSWDLKTQTSNINENAGIRAVKVDSELFDLIERSISISRLTDGAFDISYASMDQIWKFDGSMKSMPSEESIKASVNKVGYNNIVLDKENSSIFLKLQGMKIGFGAIGKGYAADKAKTLLIEKGVTAGIINASGDMSIWGKQANGDDWQIAITNPMNKNNACAQLSISNRAIVTSGNYEKYETFNNKRYTHIIDPRTGYPSSGLVSVTVLAPKAELADALSTAIFVLGKEVGLDRINQLPNIDCIIIDEEGNIFTSDNIEIEKL